MLDEVRETATEHKTRNDAYITRKVVFTDETVLHKFENMLLHDFDFLSGFGGTGTNDPRVTDENIWKLNSDQRAQVKFFSVNCVAVYLGDVLRMVINPEGYHYARYVYIPCENTVEYSPVCSRHKTEDEEAEQKEPFYIPAPVEEQAERLSVGDTVTVYQSDGWILNVLKQASGTLTGIKSGSYAQHSGVYLSVQNGRKSASVFCSNTSEQVVVFPCLPLALPEWCTYEKVTPTEYGSMKLYRDGKDQLKQIIAFYAMNGIQPIFDTVQR